MLDHSSQSSSVWLRWRGLEGSCADDSLNGKPVFAGTKVRIELAQQHTIRHERPERVWIFATPPTFIRKILHRIGYRPEPKDWLRLKRGYVGLDPECVAHTDPWILPPPPPELTRMPLICSISESHPSGPQIISTSYGSARFQNSSSTSGQAGAGFDILVPIEATWQRGRSTSMEMQVVAAVDPDLDLSVLQPGDIELD